MAANLGEVDCAECGGVASLHSMKKGKGHYLYSNCPKCKVDQRTGEPVQRRLYEGARWAAGVSPVIPANITAEDWKPDSQNPPKQEPKKAAKVPKPSEPLPKPEKSGGASVFGVLSVVTLVVGSVLVWKFKGGKGEAPKPVNPYGVQYGQY